MEAPTTKGKGYGYNYIEEFADKNGYTMHEYGKENIGENFLKLAHMYKDEIISYVLVGGRFNEYVYECIYTDI